MSRYSMQYCPGCECTTPHEDDKCMDCIEETVRQEKEMDKRIAVLYEDLSEAGIAKYEACLCRIYDDDLWFPAVFAEVALNEDDNLSYYVYNVMMALLEVSSIAPLDINVKAIGTKEDVFELWNLEELDGYA